MHRCHVEFNWCLVSCWTHNVTQESWANIQEVLCFYVECSLDLHLNCSLQLQHCVSTTMKCKLCNLPLKWASAKQINNMM